MKKLLTILAIPILGLAACAFPGRIQRIGVEYNGAVAGMANELTLLNIVRALEEMPLHYTSVGRLSGSITVRANASINVPIRGASTVATTQSTTTAAPAGTTLATAVTDAVTEGLEVFTPSLSGEIATGPSFDITILDSQEFYQGILAAVPFGTIENYVNQGYDNQLLIHLFIERIDFRAHEAGQGFAKGAIVKTLLNQPGSESIMDFVNEVGCLRLAGTPVRRTAQPIAPVSRVTSGENGTVPLTFEELAIVDGQNFELSRPLTTDPAADGEVLVQRVFPERRVPALALQSVCPIQPAARGGRRGRPSIQSVAAIDPAQLSRRELPFAGIAVIAVENPDGQMVNVTTDVDITFRSTEGIIRHVGAYLRAHQSAPDAAYLVSERPLFEFGRGSPGRPVVTTELLGRHYFVADDDNRRRNMTVIAIIQQLINLHKKSSDRPVTVPVRAVP